jgi:hypothetical protein
MEKLKPIDIFYIFDPYSSKRSGHLIVKDIFPTNPILNKKMMKNKQCPSLFNRPFSADITGHTLHVAFYFLSGTSKKYFPLPVNLKLILPKLLILT